MRTIIMGIPIIDYVHLPSPPLVLNYQIHHDIAVVVNSFSFLLLHNTSLPLLLLLLLLHLLGRITPPPFLQQLPL